MTPHIQLEIEMRTALANGSSATIQWRGGRGVVYVGGATWGGATLTLTWSEPAGSTAIPIGTGVTLTADGCTLFEMPPGNLTATISGGDGTTSIPWDVGRTRAVPLDQP